MFDFFFKPRYSFLEFNCNPREKAAMMGLNTIDFFSRTIYMKIVLYSQRSLSHVVLRLATDSLVLLMNALQRKGRVWVWKKYIEDET